MRKLTPAEIAEQHKGSRRIAPGFWADANGGIHISVPELLDLVGLLHTPENEAVVREMAITMLRRELPDVAVIEQEPVQGE